jgi:hypothetical protein
MGNHKLIQLYHVISYIVIKFNLWDGWWNNFFSLSLRFLHHKNPTNEGKYIGVA